MNVPFFRFPTTNSFHAPSKFSIPTIVSKLPVNCIFIDNNATCNPRHSILPITEHLTSAYKAWHEFLAHVPRDFRYTLGAKIDRSLIETAELLFIASYLEKEQKLGYLRKAATRLDLAKFFLQILWEVRAIDNKKYATLSEKLDAVGRMLGGWIKGILSKSPAK